MSSQIDGLSACDAAVNGGKLNPVTDPARLTDRVLTLGGYSFSFLVCCVQFLLDVRFPAEGWYRCL
jgi:hypothetical protein